MIRVSNIPLSLEGNITQLNKKVARILSLPFDQVTGLTIARQSVDARKKSDVHWVYTVDVPHEKDAAIVAKLGNRQVTLHQPAPYGMPTVTRQSTLPPVVVGTGPAGLFAGLQLARAGLRPILLERGRPVAERTQDVAEFWHTGTLNPQSNVQFGEGGAGTFSDGKLTTGTHDPRGFAVLQTFIDHGAPADIAYSHKPHIGTDVLRNVVTSMREELLSLGGEVRFSHQLVGIQQQNNVLTAIQVSAPTGHYDLPCDALILAPGHSARDTFQMLFDAGVPMESKSFAIGVRIEHRQSDIGLAQYGEAFSKLPPTDYKLACHLPNGRSAFSFCVCPGGEVVASSSEPGHLVTNGMSHRARSGDNINGGLLVGVNPSDFGSDHPLSGIDFQRKWEAAAFQVGGGNYHAPATTVGKLLGTDGSASSLIPTYRPGIVEADLSLCLPHYVVDTLRGALPLLGRKLKGFDHPHALLTGIETRSSSPVRILRDTDCQSSLRGLYPCGEGAGWAGGILSAAVDGIRVAEHIINP